LVLAAGPLSRTLIEQLSGWGVEAEGVATTARAFSRLVEAAEGGTPFQVALVERQCLDTLPEQFAASVRREAALGQTALVLLDGAPAWSGQRGRHESGYAALLRLPPDTRLLFNAVHAAQAHRLPGDENVVSLAEHYRSRGASRSLHILVAEDNWINQKVILNVLQEAGHTVTLVDDGEKALDALAAPGAGFDLIVLDMNMPVVSGLDVAKAYRFMHTDGSAPILVLSADATPAAAQACRTAGVNAYLTKPTEPRVLLATIAELVGAPPAPASAPGPARRVEARLDEFVLGNLLRLGSGAGFVKELAEGFAQDGEQTLALVRSAWQDRDWPRFRDAIHALKGSAGELGGVMLVRRCLEAEAIKPYEFDSPRTQDLIAEIEQTFVATCAALTEYLARQRDAVT
jgi:two-component system sensor histidine kinase RpfC